MHPIGVNCRLHLSIYLYKPQKKEMREIKVGNILIYRKERACVVSRIIAGDDNLPDIIIGTDHNNCTWKGPLHEWSSILHMKHMLRPLEDAIFKNIVAERGY